MNSSITPANVPSFDLQERNIAVFAAWPYANGPRHLGHGASLVTADVLARYHREAGDNVMMISGTDEHGTPNLIAADEAGIDTLSYVTEVNEIIRHDFANLGMSFDRFSRTTAPEHARIVQEIFVDLVDKEFIAKDTMLGSFDEETDQALPDRYIEGSCPHCGSNARGDQCDDCSNMLDPTDLINPVSKLTKNPVVFRETEHYFLLLDKLAPQVKQWLSQSDLRPNAKKASIEMADNLRPRAITRDMSWGVPLPDGFQLGEDPEKVLYVWFEAVIGYLSTSIQWAEQTGNPDDWKKWWLNENAKHYYSMGKDNIPFHTLIWPAILVAHSNETSAYHLPDTIVSTEYLTFNYNKLSSSRGNVVYVDDMISLVGADTLRYYLLSSGPETSDKNFSFSELVNRNNTELIGNWGNLVNRVVNMTNKQLEGEITDSIDPEKLSTEDKAVFLALRIGFDEVGELISATEFRKAIKVAFAVSAHVNKYLYEEEPWKKIKTDLDRAKEVLFVAQTAIHNLSKLLSPFLPHSSQKVQDMLKQDTNIFGSLVNLEQHDGNFVYEVLTGDYASTKGLWGFSYPKPASNIDKPIPLFEKLDEEELVNKFKDINKVRTIGNVAITHQEDE